MECGLLGRKLGHSYSPQIHACLGDYSYTLFEKEPEEVADFLKNGDFTGLNVTIPYKEAVIPYLNEMDETARLIGAVNVIKFIQNKGKLILKGYNSDIIGFTDSIKPLLTRQHKYALILGTGGASKAVWHGLESLDITPTLVSRTPKEGVLTYKDLTPEIIDKYKVIVNTTPVGMYPHVDECPDIPYTYLTEDHLIYDLLYNPDETLFMKKAKERGATVKNGLEMLLLQAFAAWDIWQK